jgi:UDP-N-acetylmuramoylalanine--D-glutamate ligase
MKPIKPVNVELNNKKVIVVGLGKTGVATASFLKNRGARVTVTDLAPEAELGEYVPKLHAMGIRLELGLHRPETFTGSDLIVLSPGVPHNIGPIVRARENGIGVMGEIELASRFIGEPIIAVTGTNGKTTTTSLLGEMLKESGLRAFVGGNIGRPLIGYLDQKKKAEVIVAEISSFQLDTIDTFRPRIAVLLNIANDHLDRYPDFEAYVRSKLRIFENQQARDIAILNGSDPKIRSTTGQIASRTWFVTGRRDGEAGSDIADETIRLHLNGGLVTDDNYGSHSNAVNTPLTINRNLLRIPGKHNAENAAAASLAALASGGTLQGVKSALRDFRGLAHRLEHIAKIDGVSYFNDSKATNIDAVARALACFNESVILIMGGRNKGGNFQDLAKSVGRHVKHVIALGEAKQDIISALSRVVSVITATNMEDAVIKATRRSVPGNVVLLSPACSSFDMYKDYAHRGAVFTDAVKKLEKNRHD